MNWDALREVIALSLAMVVWWAYCGPLICLLCRLAYRACKWLLKLRLRRPRKNPVEPVACPPHRVHEPWRPGYDIYAPSKHTWILGGE